jgi:hypothetical protein
MKLLVPERYALLDMLPREGSFTTIKLVRKLREKLSFTEAEIATYELKEVTSTEKGIQVQWKADHAPADIDFTSLEYEMIVKSLKEKDNNQKLTELEFPLYEKFVID